MTALPVDFDTTRTRAEHLADHKALHRVHNRAAHVQAGGDLQAAIDAAQAIGAGNGTVQLGPGVWEYDTAPRITHPEGLHIRGAGPYRTILKPAPGVDGLQVQAARYGHQFAISDLTINGGAVGLHILDGGDTELALDRVHMVNQTVAGVWAEADLYNFRATNCAFFTAPVGVRTSGLAHIGQVSGCAFIATTDAALDLTTARAWRIEACRFENNTGNVARIHHSHTVAFVGGWLEDNGIAADTTMFVVTGVEGDLTYDIMIGAMFLSDGPTIFLDASDPYVNRVSLVRQAINACEVRLPGGRVIPYAPGEGRVVSIDMVERYEWGASGTLWRVNVTADGTETRIQVGA